MDLTKDTTLLLRELGNGEPGAAEQLLSVVYADLHAVAEAIFRQQRADHTLQPTALVHEAFLRLVNPDTARFEDRAHFFAVAATAMRQIMIDHARRRGAAKRGAGMGREPLDGVPAADARDLHGIDVIALDDALRALAELNARQARVVEMRFFGGLTVDETAAVLDVSPRTVDLDWRMAKAWLSRELSENEP